MSSLKQGELSPSLEQPWYHGKTKLSYTMRGKCDGFTVTNHELKNMEQNKAHCAEATLGFEPTSIGNKVHPFATRTHIIHTVVIGSKDFYEWFHPDYGVSLSFVIC